MLDLIREISQTLRNNRLRTALTGIAVAWGIFMLIVLLGAAKGVVNSFTYHMSQTATNTIAIWGGRTSMAHAGYKDGRPISLKSADMQQIRHDYPAVSSAAAKAYENNAQIIGPLDAITGFDAVYPAAMTDDRPEMLYGRMLNERDISERRRVMVLHKNNATLLFGDPQKAMGQVVKSLSVGWTIVGVYNHRWRSSTYVPYTTYKALTGNDDSAYQITVAIDGMSTEEDGKAAEKAIRTTLAHQHSFNPDDNNAVWTWNRFTQYLTTSKGFGYLNLAVWVIGIFTLLSGIVGVSNIMFVSVRERTHEIGIRRAIGAKPRSILTQVIAESIAITAIFGYIGVVLGMGLLQMLDSMLGESEGFRNPTIDINIAVQVTIALVIAGALAGLFPALKAIKVKPVEALRDE